MPSRIKPRSSRTSTTLKITVNYYILSKYIRISMAALTGRLVSRVPIAKVCPVGNDIVEFGNWHT